MEKSRSLLKSSALKSLKGNWLKSIGALIISMFIPVTLAIIFKDNYNLLITILTYIVEIPFIIGLTIYFLYLAKDENPDFSKIFDSFKNLFSYIALYLETYVFTFFWTLLLVIPGIIKSLSYSMAPYILIDDPTLRPLDAITKSKQMMEGHKWELFVLQFSFIGWELLSTITFGIGFIWLFPYIHTTIAKFYLELKNKQNVDNTEDKDKKVVTVNEIPNDIKEIEIDNNNSIKYNK